MRTAPAASVLAVVAMTGAAGAARAAENVKIGYVDLQRALNETEDGKNARARLKSLFDQKQAQLDKEQEAFKKSKEDLDKQKVLLKPDVAAAKERELEAKFVELQALYVKLQKEISAKEAELTKDIFAKLQKIIAQIAERDGFTIVLEKNESSILWARPHLDLTNEMIRLYNAGAR